MRTTATTVKKMHMHYANDVKMCDRKKEKEILQQNQNVSTSSIYVVSTHIG